MKHVIFGSGPVGLAVMDELLAQGERSIRVVNRRGEALVPEGVEVRKGDVSDPEAAKALSEGAEVLYGCVNPAYTEWVKVFPGLQAGLIAAARASGARLVMMENLYMYGLVDGHPLTEDLPFGATNRKGTTRARMAQDLMAAHQRGDIRATAGRASDFVGRACWGLPWATG
ncbi:MAG: NAD(P)H-binding protein [Anaerolineae bacterium]|nr:NAD(P)H-binding protein [Anaerolineae bacterium]